MKMMIVTTDYSTHKMPSALHGGRSIYADMLIADVIPMRYIFLFLCLLKQFCSLIFSISSRYALNLEKYIKTIDIHVKILYSIKYIEYLM